MSNVAYNVNYGTVLLNRKLIMVFIIAPVWHTNSAENSSVFKPTFFQLETNHFSHHGLKSIIASKLLDETFAISISSAHPQRKAINSTNMRRTSNFLYSHLLIFITVHDHDQSLAEAIASPRASGAERRWLRRNVRSTTCRPGQLTMAAKKSLLQVAKSLYVSRRVMPVFDDFAPSAWISV